MITIIKFIITFLKRLKVKCAWKTNGLYDTAILSLNNLFNIYRKTN